jgi:hypothetical protein
LIDRTIVERTAPRLGPLPLVRVAGDDVDNHAEIVPILILPSQSFLQAVQDELQFYCNPIRSRALIRFPPI